LSDLDDIVEKLCAQRGSVFERAVDLFEFQVGIFRPSKAARRRARVFAAIKLVEYLEKSMGLRPGIDLTKALKSKDFRYVFGEAFHGGWVTIRRLPSDKSFDNKILKNRDKAQFVANIIDFLYRYDTATQKKPASISRAQYVVATADSYDSKLKKTAAKERWGVYRESGIFIYLLLIQKFEFMAPRVGTVKFAERLLKKTSNLEGLLDFFAAYNLVANNLNSKRVEFPLLSLPALQHRTPEIHADKFSPSIDKQIEKYKSNVDWSIEN
jgi:hypothetical protein